MKIGINLPNFGPGMDAQTLLGWARTIEDLGYDLLLVSDHVALTPDAAGRSPEPFYEAFTSLAWLAGQTSRIEIGTGVVIMPHRHPVLLARMGSTLDQLSQGRFVLGVGVGWARQGYQALNVPYTSRGRLTDEYLVALRRLWTDGRATFRGETVSFTSVHTAPMPHRRPTPPIWIGGNSLPAVRRAARHGDAWHPLWPRADWLKQVAVPTLRKLTEEEGRPPVQLCPRIQVSLTSEPLPDATRQTGHGTTDQLRDDLRTLEAMGCSYVILDTDPGDQRLRGTAQQDWRTLETIATQVIDLATHTVR
ncbi:TIGR03619 family F420-dependent LLM class oxidoreductase [Streptomyces sp. NBC_01335]|uniref:TIGR03619 family F420-dependent LLM class oxidoreductase n=1 Tax=Streptomyces sp. NBC_01335 TaxID=2903828 RepID=UPI002E106FBA|nr:TIGR03619 family F420-dependent LLM class oxidoreductase [Streptomyces sp. NBC_01335]